MSLLAPLYFFGALAVGLPILFHLIRRQPKGQVEFSSLMFLKPTPPRLTRRSRLDNWFLLLLRGLALTLLAAAFARPFLRSTAISEAELPGRRIVLMVDTSASMQRAGLWQQSLDKAREVLADLQPADSLALVLFDSEPKLAVSFDESETMDTEQLRSTVDQALQQAKPSWRHTDLGRAISFAGDIAVTFEADTPVDDAVQRDAAIGEDAAVSATSSGPAHLILITDMQSGSRIDSLQAYAWPKDLRLDVRKVAAEKRTNASAQILATSADETDDLDRVRVRVSNAADSDSGKFSLAWSSGNASSGNAASSNATPNTRRDASTGESSSLGDGGGGESGQRELPVQVPPGQTRVIRMPTPPVGADSLVLRGDAHSFDNTRYVISPQPVQMSLVFIGDEAADPRESLLYYLERVPLQNSTRSVTFEAIADNEAITAVPEVKQVPLVVLARELDGQSSERLREFVEAGGRLLVVLSEPETSAAITTTLNSIAGSELQVEEASVGDYVMLTKIDFAHPLFQPMSDPQFNDFSKIRFWAHRTLNGMDDSWNVLASFDDGDPALIEKEMGRGRVFVLATGWQPRAGQLALSTKFIPFVYSLFEMDRRSAQSDRYTVGQTIDYPPSPTATITGPAGTEFAYQSDDDLDGIDQPGVYTYREGDETRTFAVNLAESESRTEPIGEDELERFGAILGKNTSTEEALETQRQLRDRELESRQKLWQWLLVTALGILGLETLLGGLWSRRGREVEGAEGAVGQ